MENNSRPLTVEDVRPYTIPNTVFAVRLFRKTSCKWLAGQLWKIDIHRDGCRINFDRYVEIGHHELIDLNDPGEGLFVDFRLVAGSLSEDPRELIFTEPRRVDTSHDSETLSIKSTDGSAIVSSRCIDLQVIQRWLGLASFQIT